MTSDDIKKARAIIDAATPGKWEEGNEAVWSDIDGDGNSPRCICEFVNYKDSCFIAEARTRWPAALDEVERLQKINGYEHDMYPMSAKVIVENGTELRRLRAVAEAARAFLVIMDECTNEDLWWLDNKSEPLRNALKAWGCDEKDKKEEA